MPHISLSSSVSSLDSYIYPGQPHRPISHLYRNVSTRTDHSTIARNYRMRAKSIRKRRRRSSTSITPPLANYQSASSSRTSSPSSSGKQTPVTLYSPLLRFRFPWTLPTAPLPGRQLPKLKLKIPRSASPQSDISPKTLVPPQTTFLEQQLEAAIVTNLYERRAQKKRLNSVVGFQPCRARVTVEERLVTLAASAPRPQFKVDAITSLVDAQQAHITIPPSPVATVPKRHAPPAARYTPPAAHQAPRDSTISTSSTRTTSTSSSLFIFPKPVQTTAKSNQIRMFLDGHWQWIPIDRKDSLVSVVSSVSQISNSLFGSIAEGKGLWNWLAKWVHL